MGPVRHIIPEQDPADETRRPQWATLGTVEEDPGEHERPPAPAASAVENVQVHEIGRRRFVVADVEPLDVNGVRTVAVGTALWAIAFVLLLPFYGRLEASGREWWLWTCVAGFGLGIIGWDYCRRRRRAAQTARAGRSDQRRHH